jgi:uncharacterized protein YdhG (YjbR/CyaY superfamily)
MAAKTLDLKAYLKALTPAQRKGLETIRKTIRAAAPGVEDSFSYGIPGFKRDGRSFLWCAAWAKHFSIYPINASMRDLLAGEPRKYETSKGTVRFPADERLPLTLIRKLVKARLAETG